MRNILPKFILACALLTGGMSFIAIARAQTPVVSHPPAPQFRSIGLQLGTGRLIKLNHPVSSVFAADPKVVEVRPASPTTLFVFGKGLGQTTIAATDSTGNLIAQFYASVSPSSYDANSIRQNAERIAPGSDVTSTPLANGVVVHGTVQTPYQDYEIMKQAQSDATASGGKDGKAFDELQVQEPQQVMLKVRIAQMQRTVTRQLGINWTALGNIPTAVGNIALAIATGTAAPSINGTTPGSIGFSNIPYRSGNLNGSLNNVIDALATDGLAHVLAEPTLMALSGQKASFLVGGQFPIPVASGGTSSAVTVTYQNYGVQLNFMPTVLSDNRIVLQVAPQVSSISTANSVTISTGTNASIVVPSLNISEATTTVMLGSGQSLAIAGLLQDQTNQNDNAVPGLGEIPILGALFRGDAFQRSETELVIVVTPYIVSPVDDGSKIKSPDDGFSPPNDLQRILLLRQNGTVAPTTTIPGQAGFMVQ